MEEKKEDMGNVGFMRIEGDEIEDIKTEISEASTSEEPIIIDMEKESENLKNELKEQFEPEIDSIKRNDDSSIVDVGVDLDKDPEVINTIKFTDKQIKNGLKIEEAKRKAQVKKIEFDDMSLFELTRIAEETCYMTTKEKQLLVSYGIYDESIIDELEVMLQNSIETEDTSLLIGAVEFITEIRKSVEGIEDASKEAIDMYKNMMKTKFEKAFDNYRKDNVDLMGSGFDTGDNRSHNLITYLTCVGMKRMTVGSIRNPNNTHIFTHNIRNFRSSLKDINYLIDSNKNYYMGDDGKVKITNINALIGLNTLFDQFFTGTINYDFDYIEKEIKPIRLVDKDKLAYPIVTNFDRLSSLSEKSKEDLEKHNKSIERLIKKNLKDNLDENKIKEFIKFNSSILNKYLVKLDRYSKNMNMNLSRKAKDNKKFLNTPKGVAAIGDKLFSEGFLRSILSRLVGNQFILNKDEEKVLPFDENGKPSDSLNKFFHYDGEEKLIKEITTLVYDMPTILNSGIFFKELKNFMENYLKHELIIDASDKVSEMDIAHFTILQDLATIISLYISYDGTTDDSVVAHMTRYFSNGKVIANIPTDYFKYYKPKEATEDILKYWMGFRKQQTKYIVELLNKNPNRYKNLMSETPSDHKKKQMKKLKNQK